MIDDQRYERLPGEQMSRVFKSIRELIESGDIGSTLYSSLIGIPQAEFDVTWPALNERCPLPGELTSYSFNGIDAYAAALLASDTLFAPNCLMTVSCEFKKNADGSLGLIFASTTDRLIPELFGERIGQFLKGFVPALAVKRIKPHGPIFCNKVGAPAWFTFGGKMLLQRSALAGIPEANWPTATRKFTVSAEVRASARNAILLLTTPDAEMYQDRA